MVLLSLNVAFFCEEKFLLIFLNLNVSEDDTECESFTVISADSLLVYKNKYFLQVYLDNCAYKIVDKRMIDYVCENPIETDKN